jgi:poly(hydroxyalkanoate) depolymerase family esterase
VVLGQILAWSPSAEPGSLVAVPGFGSNPGGLEMFVHVPAAMPASAPLVVILHGCTQTAQDMVKAGWNEIADSEKVYLVYPQQTTANNPSRCFNWFGDPADIERGKGENESVRQMVETMKQTHSIDEDRVFVTGFSAGGAFAAVMMATWPDVFSAGAVMSGLPYRCASTLATAMSCMSMKFHPERKKTPGAWGDLVRAAHPSWTGPWPRLAVFHGTRDFTVHPDNLAELVEQWTDVHGLDTAADEMAAVGVHTVARHQKDGVTLVESWSITGMGHAVAVGARDPEHPCTPPLGSAYFADRGLCASWHAAKFFGLTDP